MQYGLYLRNMNNEYIVDIVEEAQSFYRKVIIHRVKQCCAVLFIALLFNIKPDIVK